MIQPTSFAAFAGSTPLLSVPTCATGMPPGMVIIDDFLDAEPRIGKKAARRDARTAAAIAAGRKTFAQLREEAAAQNPDRYAFRNLGTRKTGMLGASLRRSK